MPSDRDQAAYSDRFTSLLGSTRGQLAPAPDSDRPRAATDSYSTQLLGVALEAIEGLTHDDPAATRTLMADHLRSSEGAWDVPPWATGTLGPLAGALKAVHAYVEALASMDHEEPLVAGLLEATGLRSRHAEGLADEGGLLHVVAAQHAAGYAGAVSMTECGRAITSGAPVERGAWLAAPATRRCPRCSQRPISDCFEAADEPRLGEPLRHTTLLWLCEYLRRASDASGCDQPIEHWALTRSPEELVHCLIEALGAALATTLSGAELQRHLERWVGVDRLERFVTEKCSAEQRSQRLMSAVGPSVGWTEEEASAVYTAVLRVQHQSQGTLADAALDALEHPHPF